MNGRKKIKFGKHPKAEERRNEEERQGEWYSDHKHLHVPLMRFPVQNGISQVNKRQEQYILSEVMSNAAVSDYRES